MPRVKPKALSAPPSQEALEDGADSTSLFTSNTVAALLSFIADHPTSTEIVPSLPGEVRVHRS